MGLTDRTTRSARVPAGLNQRDLPDQKVQGLVCRLYKTGMRVWFLFYRRREDDRRRQGLAAPGFGLGGVEGELQGLLRRYLDEEISLSKMANVLGVSRFELMERFERLGVPVRIGPATVEEAREEVRVARGIE